MICMQSSDGLTDACFQVALLQVTLLPFLGVCYVPSLVGTTRYLPQQPQLAVQRLAKASTGLSACTCQRARILQTPCSLSLLLSSHLPALVAHPEQTGRQAGR